MALGAAMALGLHTYIVVNKTPPKDDLASTSLRHSMVLQSAVGLEGDVTVWPACLGGTIEERVEAFEAGFEFGIPSDQVEDPANLPSEFAGKIDGGQIAAGKNHENGLPVGGHRGGRVAGFFGDLRHAGRRKTYGARPQQMAVVCVETVDLLLRGGRPGQKHAIVPHDR